MEKFLKQIRNVLLIIAAIFTSGTCCSLILMDNHIWGISMPVALVSLSIIMIIDEA